MLDQAAVPWLAEMNRGLNDVLDDAAFRARLHQSHRQLRVLAQEILDRGVSEHPELGHSEEAYSRVDCGADAAGLESDAPRSGVTVAPRFEPRLPLMRPVEIGSAPIPK